MWPHISTPIINTYTWSESWLEETGIQCKGILFQNGQAFIYFDSKETEI